MDEKISFVLMQMEYDTITGYHAQNNRTERLLEPKQSSRDTAWLGPAYYFWHYLDHAKQWGRDKKMKETGSYSIYSADLTLHNCLNTCFDEEHYEAFYDAIEKASWRFRLATGRSPDKMGEVWTFVIEELLPETDVRTAVFCDNPVSPEQPHVGSVYYRKRIQYAIIDPACLSNFRHLMDGP